MGLFDDIVAVPDPAKREGQPVAAIRKTTCSVTPNSIRVLAHLLETQFPGVIAHPAAMGQTAPNGEGKMVPFAVKYDDKGLKGNASLYYNGKLILAGALTELKWPLPAAEFDRVLAQITAPPVEEKKPTTSRRKKEKVTA